MIKVDIDNYTIYERGEAGFEDAWQALIAAGHRPEQYMYMGTSFDGQHDFKHRLTRRYTRVYEQRKQ